MSEAVVVTQRELSETKTPNDNALWLAECEIDGQPFSVKSRRDAPRDLARVLVKAGLTDRGMVIHHAGLQGSIRYASLYEAAEFVTAESSSTPARTIRWREFEPFKPARLPRKPEAILKGGVVAK